VFLSIACIFCAILIYLLLNERFIKLPLNIYIINVLATPFMIIQSLSVAVFQSNNNFKKVNIVLLFTGVCNLALILFSFFFIQFNVTVFSIITLFSWFFCSLYCYFSCRFTFSIKAFKKLFYKKFTTDISFLHINTIMTFLISGFNILLMHKYISDNEVGQYFLASSITGYLLILPVSIQNVLMANLINKSHTEKVRITGYFFKATLLGMILIAILLFFLSNIIVFILGGKSFTHSAFYLQCLLVSVIFQIAGIIWSSLWSIRGYFKIITKISVVIVALSVILNFTLIKSMGVSGAIITSTIITFLSMCVHIFLAIKEYKSIGIHGYEIIPQKKDFIFFKQNLHLFKYRVKDQELVESKIE
jgi:O-antigen/teichoic acid export membrane protein